MLIGLSQINIELSSYCDRHTLCGFCGHQDRKTNPNLKFGHMDFALLEKIAAQVPSGIIASFHRDGDSLVHPRLRYALKAFSHCIRSVVTHGETLNQRADDVIENCATVTISVIPNDKDREIQIDSVWRFLLKKGDRAPQVQLKFVGHIDDADAYIALGVPIIGRTLHSKKGSFKYHRIDPVVPEERVCLNFRRPEHRKSRRNLEWARAYATVAGTFARAARSGEPVMWSV